MDAPKCRTCGERHYGPICHSSKSSRGGGESRPAKSTLTKSAVGSLTVKQVEASRAQNRGGPLSTAQAEKTLGSIPNPKAGVATGPREAKFDRIAYQREYMRDRRARLAKERNKNG